MRYYMPVSECEFGANQIMLKAMDPVLKRNIFIDFIEIEFLYERQFMLNEMKIYYVVDILKTFMQSLPLMLCFGI